MKEGDSGEVFRQGKITCFRRGWVRNRINRSEIDPSGITVFDLIRSGTEYGFST